jgi:hypothetical protein
MYSGTANVDHGTRPVDGYDAVPAGPILPAVISYNHNETVLTCRMLPAVITYNHNETVLAAITYNHNETLLAANWATGRLMQIRRRRRRRQPVRLDLGAPNGRQLPY